MTFSIQHQRHDLWKKELIGWSSLRLKCSSLQKTLSRKWHTTPQTVRKYLQKIHLTKNCSPKYKKNSNSTIKNKQKNLHLKNEPTTSRHLHKEDMQMWDKHITRDSTRHVLREMEINTMRYHHTPIRKANTQDTAIGNAGEEAEWQELSSTAGGNAKRCGLSGRQFGRFLWN